MRNIFYFIINHATFIYFLVLELICTLLIVNFNDYQRSAFLSSSNAVCGSFYTMENAVGQYFSYGDANRQLVSENTALRNRVAELEAALVAVPDTVRSEVEVAKPQMKYLDARVINSSTDKRYNFLTLNKGEHNGVRPEMVVTTSGNVVGLVTAVSEHFSTVLPIVNVNFRLSVKLASSGYRGQLTWNAHSAREATMIDVPEHATVAVGDSVVTSGSSSYFFEGLPVGVVSKVEMDKNGGFYRLTVDLAADFAAIYDVEVIDNTWRKEQLDLETNTQNE